MKELISVAALLVGFFALPSVYADTTIAQVKGIDREIGSVELTDGGLVTVTRLNHTQASLQLAKTNTAELVGMAQMLSDVELVHEHHLIVCMIAINRYALKELYIADAATGELRLTLSARSCAIADSTVPKEQYQIDAAEQLKEQLVVLAHQIVNN